MPITPTYPGVYVEEVPSQVRAIAGVPTSVTAFVGRTFTGPVDEPKTVNNYGDFERLFGGLWRESSLAYAVRDFFLNGGGQALVVRLYRADEGADALPARAAIVVNGLTLEAADPGSWGNTLRARVDHQVLQDAATRYGVQLADLFNLTVRDTRTGATETFLNVTVIDSPRKVDNVLKQESRMVRATVVPNSVPAAHGDPAAGSNIWADDTLSTGVLEIARASDGQPLNEASFNGPGLQGAKRGMYALDKADLFNLLYLPPLAPGTDVPNNLWSEAAAYCERKRGFLIVDPPAAWNDKDDPKGGIGTTSKNAAIFFPRLLKPDPLRENQKADFPPGGSVAGVIARTDATRGIWKAPAGLGATLVGAPELTVPLTDEENGELNPLGINCLRSFPAAGRVVWGARTLAGNDRLASEWKYIPVRRLALHIEESLYRGTQWVVFEPNDEPLWAQIRLNVGAFMHGLFRQGAFQGVSPRDAYLVKCDRETTTQADIDLGIVNILVGFAPLKPAEFVFLKIQQLARSSEG